MKVEVKETKYVHLRTRLNGVPQERGGYTLAIRPRKDGNYFITICQCNSWQKYDEKLGEKIAFNRMEKGQYFVLDKVRMIETFHLLHRKLCVGTSELREDVYSHVI